MVKIHNAKRIKTRKALTLLELVVSIGILALLATIMMPAMNRAHQRALAIRCMDNLRKIALAANSFAADNDGLYPNSVATIGLLRENWNWQEPTMLISPSPRSPDLHRSVSAYLHDYIKDTTSILCPTAPEKTKLLQKIWDAGDSWDNPDTVPPDDPAVGTYCLYWNYVGYLKENKDVFRGPSNATTPPYESNLLASDYFGFGHWRNKLVHHHYQAYGSCEKFPGASITPGTAVSSAFWSVYDPNITPSDIDAELHAAYTDGHVGRYSPDRTVIMEVSTTPDGSVPYPARLGPGEFYLPENALFKAIY